MGLRFRKSIRIAKGVRINLSKSGASVSVGRRGASINLGKKGVRTTVGIPGSGISYSKLFSSRSTKKNASPHSNKTTQKDIMGLHSEWRKSSKSNVWAKDLLKKMIICTVIWFAIDYLMYEGVVSPRLGQTTTDARS
jgi:hypothetical protein